MLRRDDIFWIPFGILLFLSSTLNLAYGEPVVQVAGPVWAEVADADGHQMGIDKGSRAAVTMSVEHHAVHDGRYFNATYDTTVATAGQAAYILIDTINTDTECHFKFGLAANLSGTGYLFGDRPTVSDSGSFIQTRNLNRQFSDTDSVRAYSSPTVTTEGIQLDVVMVGANSKASVGGSASNDVEWILRPNSTYLLKFVSDNNATRVVYNVSWYEEEAE